ncbi:hypothetical protein LBLM1_00870 [Limosilactobacillus mucosae LM1]|uniref:Uncharacterized protein n=1 Tax=Limosilactobacillus mucosae LM1 TaxID=1130798 RepID=A0A0D4CI39_LIMMU|nr:hypothetical protein [Limosilactobacillus mucosae]AJT49798.1 hypothetical protein LBLM1_00870 [Limosilactobacillus mucosae LM1]
MNDLTVITIEHPESGRKALLLTESGENSLIENGITGARIEQKAIEDKTALFINTPDDKTALLIGDETLLNDLEAFKSANTKKIHLALDGLSGQLKAAVQRLIDIYLN